MFYAAGVLCSPLGLTKMTHDETLAALRANLESVNELKRQLRERTMIFQCEYREITAQWFGLPITFYDTYVLEDWYIAGRRMEQYIAFMSKHRTACEAYHGTSFERTPFKDWRAAFAVFAAATGLDVPQPYIVEVNE